MEENCIQQGTTTYLLNMNSEENKFLINEYKADITVEYGEQDLKELLFQAIKKEYIKIYNDSSIIPSKKEK